MGETSQPRMRTPSLMSSLQPSVKISQLPFMASIKSLFFLLRGLLPICHPFIL